MSSADRYRPLGRRAVIASGLVSGAAVLSGCGASDQAADQADGSSTGSSADSGGSGSTESATTDPTGSPSAGGEVLVETSKVPVGSAVIVKDAKTIVTQPQSGTFKGFSTVCPHEGCAISIVQQDELICPCHNSRFNLEGARVSGPAKTGLTAAPVSVAGSDVVAG